ncbi:MAG TPA: hypothetical protein VGG39_06950 [Polyangiaceae bacterium]|jgi:hypothetical protein
MRSSPLVAASLVTALAACASSASPPVTPCPAPPAPASASAPAPASAPTPASAPAPALAPAPPPALVPSPPPSGPPSPSTVRSSLDAASRALASGDFAAADPLLAAAFAATGPDAHLRYQVARSKAVRYAMAADFEQAAEALVSVIPALARHPELADEFWAHNAMMMVREAEGDPAAALAENDQATLCAERGTWEPQERAKLAFQKDRWHRAYLTRMLAESRTGTVKQALVGYAQAALDDYRTKGFPDSIAILDAYFAALDGRKDAALAAARKVDPAKDDDVEDLYLVVVGLEAGGDHAAAESVRAVMRKPGGPSLSRAIMVRWVDLDAKGPRGGGFTPWHAGG